MSQNNLPVWKQILRTNITQIAKLADFLELNESQRSVLLTKSRFALNVPLRLASKISKADVHDPLFKQFVPLEQERLEVAGYVNDPVGDTLCSKTPKMLHKYQGRVLLVTTSACAMHCRYCFRQNYDYEGKDKTFDAEIDLIRQDNTINEVILSGGDPLSLDDKILESLLLRLNAIPHVKKVRFHTRFPIGIPERIDDSFLKILSNLTLQVWFVVHTNHARELDEDVLQALKRVQKLGIPVLNQFVLLKGVNDDEETLYDLCKLLTDHGIFPYYLHQLDRVKGTAHFEVAEERGKELVKNLAKRLPGYAVPSYVREISGMPGKTPILP